MYSMSKLKARIAYYCSSISWGGLEMNTLRYAIWYNELGISCHLYCLENSPLHEEVKKTNVPFTLVPRNKKYLAYGKAKALSATLKQDAIDILIFSDNRDFSLLSITKAFFHRKLILVYYQAMLLGVKKTSPIHTWRFKQLNKWVTLLPFLKEQVIEKTKVDSDKIEVIPLGTPLPAANQESKASLQAELKLDTSKEWVVVVGRLDRQKGQLDAIEALAELHREYGIHLGLALIGEPTKNEGDTYFDELKALVASHELNDYVVFCGHQPNPTRFFPAFQQIWVPSWNETYGTVTIEGMASAIPTLGARSAGTEALIHNTDALFQPKNPESLAAVSFSVYLLEAKRTSIVAKQQEAYRTLYSKDASLNQWISFLHTLKREK